MRGEHACEALCLYYEINHLAGQTAPLAKGAREGDRNARALAILIPSAWESSLLACLLARGWRWTPFRAGGSAKRVCRRPGEMAEFFESRKRHYEIDALLDQRGQIAEMRGDDRA